ncbi:MAG: GGDEF domain-containing protein [Alphaproteobacteria bacterium]|nr:GGDEF domain-containing protein [Alphaproteobacteria bacterium]
MHPVLRRIIFWQPSGLLRPVTMVVIVLVVALLVGAHFHLGLEYEFHLFLSLPVVIAAWTFGAAFGVVISTLTIVLWLWADWLLDQHETHTILLVNTGMRYVILLTGLFLISQMRTLYDYFHTMALKDPLTGLPNRRAFEEVGHQSWAMAVRQRTPFTSIFFDLDRFKEVNDTLGHHVGDQLLRVVAEGLRKHIRACDVAGRLGGDEFALLLPDMGPVPAGRYADNLRLALLELMRANDWPVTFSIGVACYVEPPPSFRAMLADADGLMYEAKRTGRDRILQREFGPNEAADDLQNSTAG